VNEKRGTIVYRQEPPKIRRNSRHVDWSAAIRKMLWRLQVFSRKCLIK
jgi:hypothetical protein